MDALARTARVYIVEDLPSATPEVATMPSSAGLASATAGSAIASVEGVGSSTGLGTSATTGAPDSSAIATMVLVWHRCVDA